MTPRGDTSSQRISLCSFESTRILCLPSQFEDTLWPDVTAVAVGGYPAGFGGGTCAHDQVARGLFPGPATG
eukprot:3796583-Rhodomonas_salina.2